MNQVRCVYSTDLVCLGVGYLGQVLHRPAVLRCPSHVAHRRGHVWSNLLIALWVEPRSLLGRCSTVWPMSLWHFLVRLLPPLWDLVRISFTSSVSKCSLLVVVVVGVFCLDFSALLLKMAFGGLRRWPKRSWSLGGRSLGSHWSSVVTGLATPTSCAPCIGGEEVGVDIHAGDRSSVAASLRAGGSSPNIQPVSLGRRPRVGHESLDVGRVTQSLGGGGPALVGHHSQGIPPTLHGPSVVPADARHVVRARLGHEGRVQVQAVDGFGQMWVGLTGRNAAALGPERAELFLGRVLAAKDGTSSLW